MHHISRIAYSFTFVAIVSEFDDGSKLQFLHIFPYILECTQGQILHPVITSHFISGLIDVRQTDAKKFIMAKRKNYYSLKNSEKHFSKLIAKSDDDDIIDCTITNQFHNSQNNSEKQDSKENQLILTDPIATEDNFEITGCIVPPSEIDQDTKSLTDTILSDEISLESLLSDNLDVGSPAITISSEEQLKEKLKVWYNEYNVPLNSFKELLKIFHPYLNFLPLDPRTILKTKTAPIEKLDSGEFIYYGVETQIRKTAIDMSESIIKLDINIDGVQAFKSRKLQTVVNFITFQFVNIFLYFFSEWMHGILK